MILRCLLGGVALSLSGAAAAGPVAAGSAIFEPEAMLAMAERLEQAGRLGESEKVLRALLGSRSPEVRAEARFRLAQLLQKRGSRRAAVVELRTLVSEKPHLPSLRLALARLLADLGDEEAARRELRAVSSGKLPPDIALFVDRFSEALRASKPWGASFEIALAPDSNINRATRSDTVSTVIGDFQIDEDAEPKSGYGLALKAQAHRRLHLSDNADLVFRAATQADLYRSSAFNDVAVDLSAGPVFRLGQATVGITAGLTNRWYGQKPFVRASRVAASVALPLDRQSHLRLSGSAAQIKNHFNPVQSGRSYGMETSIERALSPTLSVGLNLGGNRMLAFDPGYSTKSWRVGLSARRDIGRASFSASAEFGRLTADRRLLLFPEKRSDRSARYTLGATLRQLGFAGFAPIGRLIIERNRSSMEFYDYTRTRTEVGIVRAL